MNTFNPNLFQFNQTDVNLIRKIISSKKLLQGINSKHQQKSIITTSIKTKLKSTWQTKQQVGATSLLKLKKNISVVPTWGPLDPQVERPMKGSPTGLTLVTKKQVTPPRLNWDQFSRIDSLSSGSGTSSTAETLYLSPLGKGLDFNLGLGEPGPLSSISAKAASLCLSGPSEGRLVSSTKLKGTCLANAQDKGKNKKQCKVYTRLFLNKIYSSNKLKEILNFYLPTWQANQQVGGLSVAIDPPLFNNKPKNTLRLPFAWAAQAQGSSKHSLTRGLLGTKLVVERGVLSQEFTNMQLTPYLGKTPILAIASDFILIPKKWEGVVSEFAPFAPCARTQARVAKSSGSALRLGRSGAALLAPTWGSRGPQVGTRKQPIILSSIKSKQFESSYSKLTEINLITIRLASSNRIRQWAEKTLPNGKVVGEVINPETIHYKTLKPIKGGLFCERIFGPLKDHECACGRKFNIKNYLVKQNNNLNVSSTSALVKDTQVGAGDFKLEINKHEHKRYFCSVCDVEYTYSIIRRTQLGYIQLASPTTHVWFVKGMPSYISILLDMKKKYLLNVTYNSETLTLEHSFRGRQYLPNSPKTIFESWQKIMKTQYPEKYANNITSKILDVNSTIGQKSLSVFTPTVKNQGAKLLGAALPTWGPLDPQLGASNAALASEARSRAPQVGKTIKNVEEKALVKWQKNKTEVNSLGNLGRAHKKIGLKSANKSKENYFVSESKDKLTSFQLKRGEVVTTPSWESMSPSSGKHQIGGPFTDPPTPVKGVGHGDFLKSWRKQQHLLYKENLKTFIGYSLNHKNKTITISGDVKTLSTSEVGWQRKNNLPTWGPLDPQVGEPVKGPPRVKQLKPALPTWREAASRHMSPSSLWLTTSWTKGAALLDPTPIKGVGQVGKIKNTKKGWFKLASKSLIINKVIAIDHTGNCTVNQEAGGCLCLTGKGVSNQLKLNKKIFTKSLKIKKLPIPIHLLWFSKNQISLNIIRRQLLSSQLQMVEPQREVLPLQVLLNLPTKLVKQANVASLSLSDHAGLPSMLEQTKAQVLTYAQSLGLRCLVRHRQSLLSSSFLKLSKLFSLGPNPTYRSFSLYPRSLHSKKSFFNKKRSFWPSLETKTKKFLTFLFQYISFEKSNFLPTQLLPFAWAAQAQGGPFTGPPTWGSRGPQVGNKKGTNSYFLFFPLNKVNLGLENRITSLPGWQKDYNSPTFVSGLSNEQGLSLSIPAEEKLFTKLALMLLINLKQINRKKYTSTQDSIFVGYQGLTNKLRQVVPYKANLNKIFSLYYCGYLFNLLHHQINKFSNQIIYTKKRLFDFMISPLVNNCNLPFTWRLPHSRLRIWSLPTSFAPGVPGCPTQVGKVGSKKRRLSQKIKINSKLTDLKTKFKNTTSYLNTLKISKILTHYFFFLKQTKKNILLKLYSSLITEIQTIQNSVNLGLGQRQNRFLNNIFILKTLNRCLIKQKKQVISTSFYLPTWGSRGPQVGASNAAPLVPSLTNVYCFADVQPAKQDYNLMPNWLTLVTKKTREERYHESRLETQVLIVNNIYCLSHRELWEQEKDWQDFAYYYYSPTTITDLVIPIYKHRNYDLLFSSEAALAYTKINYFPKQIELYSLGMNINTAFSGAGLIQKLLNDFNYGELKKMDKQNRILLFEYNKHIKKIKKLINSRLIKSKVEYYKACQIRDVLIRRTKLTRKIFNNILSQSNVLSPNNNKQSLNNKQTNKPLKRLKGRKKVGPNQEVISNFIMPKANLIERNGLNMILTLLPVLPPVLRPVLKMSGQFTISDLNRLYQRIIYRNERLKKFLKDPALNSSFEMKYAQRLLQEAVDNLIQNGKSGVVPEKDARGRLLKSLSDILKGKQGRFRQYLLGKRVDYSGRSVIVVGPRLKLHECGIPKEMALVLYSPFLIKRILNEKLADTYVYAKKLIKTNPLLVSQLLLEIMKECPILLNRAPTLHRLGFQAFQPKLVDGKAILLHPLVCPAFNADFDGDQMAVHVPITFEARAEAWKLMLARNNLTSPATGEPIILPSQDMVLGCYYLTTNCAEKFSKFKKGSGMYFYTINDVLKAYNQQLIHIHAVIWVNIQAQIENGNILEQPLEIRIPLNKFKLIKKRYHIFKKNQKTFCNLGWPQPYNPNETASKVFYNCLPTSQAKQHNKIRATQLPTWPLVDQREDGPVKDPLCNNAAPSFAMLNYIEIYSKVHNIFNSNGFLINQIIRTTPGKILFNMIIKNAIEKQPVLLTKYYSKTGLLKNKLLNTIDLQTNNYFKRKKRS